MLTADEEQVLLADLTLAIHGAGDVEDAHPIRRIDRLMAQAALRVFKARFPTLFPPAGPRR